MSGPASIVMVAELLAMAGGFQRYRHYRHRRRRRVDRQWLRLLYDYLRRH